MRWYSNRARGERTKKALPSAGVTLPSPGENLGSDHARFMLGEYVIQVIQHQNAQLESETAKELGERAH